jgi:hypothetical protein
LKLAQTAPLETAHPVYDRTAPLFTREQLDRLAAKIGRPAAALEMARYRVNRERKVRLERQEPLYYGYELPHWKDTRRLLAEKDELYCLGGNGSAKTEFGAKIAVETLLSAPGRHVLCVTRNVDLSKANQQAGVWKYLPEEIRLQNENKARSSKVKIGYSQANGFTEQTLVVVLAKWKKSDVYVRGSQMWFKTVEQFQRDKTSFEGPEYDLVWIDEPAPMALVETLKYRAGKRGGKMLFTFTAIEGYDSVCKSALDGSRITKTLPADFDWGLQTGVALKESGRESAAELVIPELSAREVLVEGCPPGHMPYIVQPLDANKAVICFWMHWNPFLPNLGKLMTKARGRPKAEIRCRLFGWAEKMSGSWFPGFTTSVHVVPEARVPKEGTDYMVDDPGSAKSHFLLWLRVDRMGRKWVFDESPQGAFEGEWVTPDGEAGDGQRLYAHRGVEWYQDYIRAIEARHNAEAGRPADYEEPTRYGDPRFFATEAATAKGSTSLLDMHLMTDHPMVFLMPGIKRSAREDIQIINDWLDYDREQPLSVLNEPKLFISDRCQNLIRAMVNLTIDAKSEDPNWDPIDCLRYVAVTQPCFNDPQAPNFKGGGGW